MSSPPELREQLETALGSDYRLERELAGGGMSRLFLATERTLSRPVVIKLLPRELTSELTTARFRREIALAAQLQHPHILPVLAAGARDGLLYYVMPYLPGETLRRRLDRERRLSLGEALRILHELAEAIAYAHRNGVVHRDLKPENVLLEEGHAVLTDFGIARALAESGSGERLTGTGLSVGTPGYMAPEQAAGERLIDARADVYSLAVVGYEMLAGEPPFTGPNAQAVLAAHLTAEPPPLRRSRPDVPEPVSEAIHRALAKSPDDRFRTAAEFRDALLGAGSAALSSDEPGARRPAILGRLVMRLRSLFGSVTGAQLPTGVVSRTISPCRVAVLPFSIRGSERLAYLGDGMVDLLSAKLGGTDEYSVADPRAILGIVRQLNQPALDPARGRAVAERVGAGRFILGSLIEAGGRLQLTASMYDSREAVVATAHATAKEEAQIFELVDEVAIKLLTETREGASDGGPRLSAATTHSLTALRAYLEGERHFRDGRYTQAKDAFQRAVDADPMFALAWYRLSVAAEWAGVRELLDEAAEEALHRSARLSEHDRQLLKAFVAWRRGDRSAEAQYRNIIASYPNDVEAWFQLGEVLFHYGPMCGRSLAASREAWERVLSFEPRHLAALHHLARIAAVEEKRAELDELTNRILELSRDSERAVEMKALRAFALGDVAEQRSVLGQLRQASDTTLIITVRTLVTNGGTFDGAHQIACLATEPSRDIAVQTLGHVQCAYLQVARGRWSAARTSLASAAARSHGAALEARAFLSALPFSPVDAGEIADLREMLREWNAAEMPELQNPSMFVRIHNGIHEHIRLYLLGILSARLDEPAEAEQYASAVDRLGRSRIHRALGRALAAGIRADAAARRGSPEEALTILDQGAMEISYDPPMASPFYSGTRERFLRAELLSALGRDDEALPLYQSFGEISVYDVVYDAVGHRRCAETYERRGDVERAGQHRLRLEGREGTGQ